MEWVKASQWRRPGQVGSQSVNERVAAMIRSVAEEGDRAIARWSRELDGFEPEVITLKPWREYALDDELRGHLEIAASRIRAFAQMQRRMYRDDEINDEFGRFGQKIVPVHSMAAYIPSGRFPLVSTALMTLIPAQVAGVPQRVAVSPGNHPAILAAASLAGADRLVRLGGAQAIAAMAFGSRWHHAVDMVVGPGNAYVNAAKAQLSHRIKIDSLAGPSEILVLCDGTSDVRWVALDVLAQAEHDPMALSVVAATDRNYLTMVEAAIRAEIEPYTEKGTGLIQFVTCRDTAGMIDFANRMAPEHLHVACLPENLDSDRLLNYGSLFEGAHSAVAMGDYCSGPNHTLPTLGHARQKGGLHVGDFLRVLTYQSVNPQGYDQLAATAISLARTENLLFHQKSLEVRNPGARTSRPHS